MTTDPSNLIVDRSSPAVKVGAETGSEAGAAPAGIPADLSELLQCPVTGQTLRWMNPAELDALHAAAHSGSAVHLDHSAVEGHFSAALVTQDAALAYLVIDSILMLLPASAIALTAEAMQRHAMAHRAEKDSVQSFYDQIGWKKDHKGEFEDALLFEDLRPVSAEYIRKCHLRVNRYLDPRGKYLLDVASGPVQYAEYLSYSAGYDHRICMDFSIAALREARNQVGERGVYILGDITHLPLRTDALDAVISIHTIYHVPKDEQATAFEELYRVLKPGRRGLIVYTFGNKTRLCRVAAQPAKWMRALRKTRLVQGLKPWLRRKPAPQAPPGVLATSPAPAAPRRAISLYYCPHPLSYFTAHKWSFPLDIVVWRSCTVPGLRSYIHPKRAGRLLLRVLYGLEGLFPHFLGRYGPYPMFLLKKPPGS